MVSFVGTFFTSPSLSKLQEIGKDAQRIANATSAIVLCAGGTALIYKITGAALSALTGGKYTLLGTVIFSSKLFYVSLALGFAVAATAWTVERICSFLIDQINQP